MDPDRWRRIEILFFAALEQDAPARAAYLDAHCDGDTALRREVEGMLAAEKQASSHLSGAVGGAIRSLAEVGYTGKRVGPYVILESIDEGGMGVVYRARRSDDVFKKDVAIKIVKRGMDTDAIVRRFRHERRILASLEHPNIARVLDGGSTDDGLPYLVMEYVDGQPITAYCSQHNLRLAERLHLFRKVCHAVEHAHRNLIVHRDLKPTNILVDARGEPRLLDFGIAKILLDDEEGSKVVTTGGQRMFTPAYASPEQVKGDPVTALSDVYSLGIVLFELLTGAKAYDLRSSTPDAALRAVKEQDVRPPSLAARAAQESGRAVPVPIEKLRGDLDRIVLMAVEKDPSRRYGSVEQLANDVSNYLESRPIHARPQTVVYRATKFARRHLGGMIAAAVVLGLLTTAAVMATLEARRTERRFAHLRKMANSFLFELHDELQTVPGTVSVRESMIRTLLEYLDGVSREPGGDATLQWEVATAYQRVGDLQGYATLPNLGRTQAALESHSKALVIAQQLVAGDPTEKNRLLLARAHQRVGSLLRNLGRTEESRQHLHRGLEFIEGLAAARAATPEETELRLRLHGATADLARDTGRLAESAEHNLLTLQIAEQWIAGHPGDQSQDWLATSLWRASRGSQDAGDLGKAAEYSRRDLAIREAMLATQPHSLEYRRDLLNAHEQLAYVLYSPGNLSLEDRAAARREYESVLALAEELVAADPGNVRAQSDLIIALRNLCEALAEDDPRVAAELGRRGLDLFARTPAIPDIYPARFLSCVGQAEWQQGRKEIGKSLLAEATERQKAIADQNPEAASARQQLLRSNNLLGSVRLAEGDRTAALEYYKRALKLAQDLRSDRLQNLVVLRDLADTYGNLGLLYESQDWRQAREWYRKALDIWTEWPRSSPSTRMDQGRRQKVLAAVTRCDAALASEP